MTEILSLTHEDTANRQQLKEMKEELHKLDMVNEFAQYARLERRINSLTGDIKSICMYKIDVLNVCKCL